MRRALDRRVVVNDRIDGVPDSDHGIDGIIGDVDVKGLPEFFDNLDDRQRIDAEIFIESGRLDDRFRLTTDHRNDDAGELIVDNSRGRHTQSLIGAGQSTKIL